MQCLRFLVRIDRKTCSKTPGGERVNSYGPYECSKIRHPIFTEVKLIDEDNFVDELDTDNGALDLPKSGILQTREYCVDAHIVPFNKLAGVIATDLCG